nr:MAG TPA: hypothetical protein [Caudoviricetes sp.]
MGTSPGRFPQPLLASSCRFPSPTTSRMANLE